MRLSEFTHPFLRSRWAVAALVIVVMVTAVSSCSDDSDEHQMHSMSDEAADPHLGHDMEGAATSPQMSPVDHSQHSDPLKQKAQVWSCSMHPHIQRDGPGQCPLCCLLYTSPSPRDKRQSRMPSSA